jgi:hypothetical protein
MSSYIGTIPTPQATQTRQTFIATASQTTFNTAGYTAGFVDVYMNGVKLVDGTDFTATNGSTVVLTTGAAASDIIEVVAYSTFEVNSQNFTGDFSVDTNTLYVDSTNNRVGIGNAAPTQALDVTGDIVTSGGVYLGGTGSANKLDDYEEGTWTPFWGGTVSDPSASYSLQSGRYTKIGRMVYVTFILISSGTPSGGSGDLLVAGLPFAYFATNLQAQGYIGIVNNISNNMSSSQLMLVGQTASTNINVMNCSGTSTTSSSNLSVTACHNSGSRVDGTFIYSIA